MSYYNKFNKKQKGGNYETKWLKTMYITEEGEILEPTFKDEYKYNFINTITDEKTNGIKQNIRIVQLRERKPKQTSIQFD